MCVIIAELVTGVPWWPRSQRHMHKQLPSSAVQGTRPTFQSLRSVPKQPGPFGSSLALGDSRHPLHIWPLDRLCPLRVSGESPSRPVWMRRGEFRSHAPRRRFSRRRRNRRARRIAASFPCASRSPASSCSTEGPTRAWGRLGIGGSAGFRCS